MFAVADPVAAKVRPFAHVSATWSPNDPISTQEITSQRLLFPKPVHLYKMLRFFGSNIVATEFDEWKRFKKITAPAFSEVCVLRYGISRLMR